MSWLSAFVLKLLGWRISIRITEPEKCVLCVAPHTSNSDFIYALLYDKSRGGKTHFLMKKAWFFWPLGVFFRSLGGIAVDRSRKSHLTDDIATQINNSDNFKIAITPEGTRSANAEWKHGFYYIALKAQVPIILYVLDYSTKTILCEKQIFPSGNVDEDMLYIKQYYAKFENAAKYPDKFIM